MIPVLLNLSGFLSYRKPVEIDFRRFDLACISGANGAGKSTIFDAITWALFGVARKNDDSLINSHPEVRSAEVRLTFAYEDTLYRIIRIRPRNKTTILELQIAQSGYQGFMHPAQDLSQLQWKPLTERSLRETQARIHEILRLDYDTFVNASFFLQGKADQFTTQNASSRKKLLSNILGLEVWETYKQRAAERRKDIENEISRINGQLSEIEGELSKEEEYKRNLKEVEAQLAQKQQQRQDKEQLVQSYRAQASAIEAQQQQVASQKIVVDNVRKKLESALQHLESVQKDIQQNRSLLEKAEEIEARHKRYGELRQELDQLQTQFQSYSDIHQRRQKLEATLQAEQARLELELSQLDQEEKQLEAAREEINKKQGELATVTVELENVERELEQRQAIQSLIEQTKAEIARMEAEKAHLMEEMNQLRLNIEVLEKNPQSANCPVCGQPLGGSTHKELIESLTVQGKTKKELYLQTKEKIQQAQTELTQLETAQKRFPALDNRFRQLTATTQNLKSQIELLRQSFERWEKVSAPRRAEITRIIENRQFLPDVRQAILALDEELRQLGYDVDHHNAVRNEENELRPYEELFRQLTAAQAALAPLEREQSALNEQIAAYQKEFGEYEKELQQAEEALNAALAQAPDVDRAERELNLLIDEENELLKALGSAQQYVNVLPQLKKRAKKLTDEKQQYQLKIVQYKQLERAFGKDGIPALLIEQALPQIEERANQTLARLSGGSMSLRFITQAEYKDRSRDDLRETLEIQISDNQGMRDYELYSGGEAFRINFAIRLAISEVLAHRAGARLQTLVIDEGFGSQDAQGRQRLIEAINLVRDQFAKILVITHLDELKEAFPARIEVEKTFEGSRVLVIA